MDDKYFAIAEEMVKRDEERDLLMSGIDDMWHGNWELPSYLNNPDLREIIDLSPHDALKSGSAILSTSFPHWTVQPLEQNPGEQNRAERTAYSLDWNFRRMCARGSGTILWDIVHSCLRYDGVAIWLEYLPQQFGPNPTLRQRHALRDGDFAATVHNVRNIHISSDAYGIHSTLLSHNIPAQAVVNRWPVRAHDLKKKLDKDDEKRALNFVYNELILYDGDNMQRKIWGHTTENPSEKYRQSDDEFVIMDEVMQTKFNPWIIKFGGSNLDTDSKYSIHPLLAPLYHTHKWKDLNVFQSILQSEIIKYGRSPRVKTITPSGDGVLIDYEDGSSLNLKGGEAAEAWRPAPIDDNLKELVDRVRAEVSSTTLPRILQNPEFAGNTPFASINAMIQTALGGLNPAKTLAEMAIAEVGLRMVEWCKHADKPLVSYRRDKSSKQGEDRGKYIAVPPDELNPDSLIISVRLFAEAPTDYTQRLNNAILENQNLKVPRSDALAKLGRENADSLYDQWVQEQLDDNEVMTFIKMSQAQAQMQLQAAAQKQQEQPPQDGGYPSNTQGLETGLSEGQGFNPNRGGNSPAVGNPGVSTREMVSGQDTTGNEIV